MRKKEKTRVLEEFIGLTGYNRSYGSWLLFNCFPHQLIVGRDKLNRKVLNHDGFCLKPIVALPGKIINRRQQVKTFICRDEKYIQVISLIIKRRGRFYFLIDGKSGAFLS